MDLSNVILQTYSAEAGSSPGQRPTLLVVDDNSDVREVIGRILDRFGYNTILASSSRSALSALSSIKKLDLALLDVFLAEGEVGPHLMGALRLQYPALRFLFMTGDIFEARRRVGQFGPDQEILQKPFTPEDLTRSVSRALGE